MALRIVCEKDEVSQKVQDMLDSNCTRVICRPVSQAAPNGKWVVTGSGEGG